MHSGRTPVGAIPAPPHHAEPDLSRFDRRRGFVGPLARALAADPELRDKAREMNLCAHRLALAAEMTPDGWGRVLLEGHRPCNLRLCPWCEWRRAGAWRRRVAAGLAAYSMDRPKDRPVLLTLTQRNVPIPELGAELARIHGAWARLTKREEFPTPAWVRRTEVTIGAAPKDPDMPAPFRTSSYGHADRGQKENDPRREGPAAAIPDPHLPRYAHPHIHVLLMAPPRYFKADYINKHRWAQLWAECLRIDYLPVIDVRAAYSAAAADDPAAVQAAAVREVAKYITKSAEIAALGDLAPEMHRQLANVRMIATSRRLSQYIKQGEITAAEMNDNLREEAPFSPLAHFAAQWSESAGKYQTIP